jgi:tetratricopeptide (TPR) repeat protein
MLPRIRPAMPPAWLALSLSVLLPSVPAPADEPKAGEHAHLGAKDPLADARVAVADGDFAKAVALLDAHLAAKDSAADETLYLKGNARALDRKFPEAVKVLERPIAEHPGSEWRRKAAFRIADCWLGATPPDHTGAAAVLEREVTALTGRDRKAESADVYLKFADEAFAPTAKDAAGRPVAPRYDEAKRFYELAAEVGLSDAGRMRVEFHLGLCELRLGNAAAAIAALKAFLKKYAKDETFLPEAGYALGEAHLAAERPALRVDDLRQPGLARREAEAAVLDLADDRPDVH